uniref:Uncharacterized protein n=1 Tax=Anopheles albimanus TaxID=7167 RepID=A0A182FG39_ANOAL
MSMPPRPYQYQAERESVKMEPKFVHFIKFNGYLIVALVCYCSFVRTVEWLALLQSWYRYPSQQGKCRGWFRREHPIVAGALLLGWITVAAFLYQGLNLEVEAFVLPIGYLFALEVLIVVVQDVISTWSNDADERFLRDGQDVVMWAVEDAEADEEDGQNGRAGDDRGDRGDVNGEKEKLDEEHSLRDDGSPEPPNGEIVSILRKNGSLLQSHQQNFFRMLDQKIEEGPDYDSSSETEQALEEARLNALVQHWESASLTTSMCSSTSRSLQGTPVRQAPLR